nr:methyltransferase domain-containing protein [Variovorax boronicumulans]
MERLDVAVPPARASMEAAIHFARYAIAKRWVQGKRVLDIACGEGYGSYLLKQAGAGEVVGVDISTDSVERATRSFGTPGLNYIAADVADIDGIFEENSFDLVISVETIEHLKDPVAFLKSLRRLAKPDAVIIISCPNDHWYYPEAEKSNPYHLRKYWLKEFQSLSTSVLGSRVNWSMGTCVFGFGTAPLSPENYAAVPSTWMSYRDVSSAYLAVGASEVDFDASRSSYFVGVWNAPDESLGIAVFPLPMDAYEAMAEAQYGYRPFEAIKTQLEIASASATKRVQELEDYTQALQKRCVELEQHAQSLEESAALVRDRAASLEESLKSRDVESRRNGLLLAAARAEGHTVQYALHRRNEMVSALRESMSAMERDLHLARVGYERYIRLRRVIPLPLRTWIVKTVKAMRHRGA